VNPRYLILAVVLGAGCEQLKSPKRIHELEGRVDELAKDVATLKGEPAPAKPKPRKAEDHGKDKDQDEEHGKPEGHAKPEEREGEEHGAGGGERRGEDREGKAAHVEPVSDRSGDKPSDDPMERLKAVVVNNTRGDARKPADKPADKHDAPHWSYDGKTGPAAWGALDSAWTACAEGQAQSPIDIEPKPGTASPIDFHYKPTLGAIVDNGHTLQVNLAPGSSISIEGRAYDLLQFHFHTPSEHTFAGEHYPLEVHLVHKDAKGKLAVIGVLYDVGAESKALDSVWTKWPRKVGAEDKLKKPFDPSTLLPETRTVFRYPGSLTTPPCSEGVVWNVMRRTLSDSREHFDLFATHYLRNARDPQPLNDRKVD
jgi:carbonic anhydrase